MFNKSKPSLLRIFIQNRYYNKIFLYFFEVFINTCYNNYINKKVSKEALMANINIILISAAFVLALVAIYVLYAIMMYQGHKNGKGNELQLSTKNILEQVQVLFDKQEYALVELLATKYLDRVPSHQEVRQYLAKSYFKSKKYNNTIRQCLIILKRDHNNIDIRKLLADSFIKKIC